MQIYQSEINDGLEQAMGNHSIAIECPIVSEHTADPITVIKAAFNDDQKKQDDLYYLNSVLVSAGWNKNDDVFAPSNLWAARHTPVDKQFNFMHDETDIIGHMTASMVLDQDGNVVSDDISEDELPEKLDIITSAVIYKTWSDPEMRNRIHEITEEIDNGDWSVSMECVFNDFDYALISPDGESRTLARTADSAFLTKHLRAYGGKGEYEGYKVGRLLKNFYFSGKGLVNKPANPRSIIFSKDINPFNSKADITITNFLTAMETDNMSDVNEQVTQLEQSLSDAKAELETVKADLTQEKEDLKAEMEQTVAEKDQLIASLETKVKELEDAIAEMHKDKEKMKEENEYMKKKMKNMKRKAALVEAGASDEDADDLLSKFSDASDEMFTSVVALVESKQPTPEPEPEPSSDASEDDDQDDVSDSLDDVDEVDDSLALDTSDELDEMEVAMTKASEWLRNSVLKTTKQLQK